MACSKCGSCCKWLLFTMDIDMFRARLLAQQDVILFNIHKNLSYDEERYFRIRGVEYNKEKQILIIHNINKSKLVIVPKSRKTKELRFYMPCPKLRDDNLCGIWDVKPNVCDYKKSTLTIWKPPGCTD